MNRQIAISLIAIATGLLTACANAKIESSNGLSGEGSQNGASAYASAPQSEGSNTTKFHPFADPNETSRIGQRIVIANPKLADVLKTGPLPDRAQGKTNAPVTIVKYASLTCPICRRFMREVYPQFKREYIDTGKVRFVIREFPIGRSSGNAAIALRCAKPEKYFTLYQKFLQQQGKWVSQNVRLDAIYGVASQVGMKRNEFDACLKNQAIINGLKWIKDRGRSLGVIGTPNFFIQSKLIKNTLDMKALREHIDPLLATPVAAAKQKP